VTDERWHFRGTVEVSGARWNCASRREHWMHAVPKGIARCWSEAAACATSGKTPDENEARDLQESKARRIGILPHPPPSNIASEGVTLVPKDRPVKQSHDE